MWQPCDQLSLRDFAVSIREEIRIKRRSRLADPFQEIRADNLNRLPLEFYQSKFASGALSVQPIHRFEQPTKLRIIRRQRRQPFTNWLAFPPPFFAQRREPITIKSRPNVTRRRVRKGTVREQRQRACIVMEKFPNKMQCPRVFAG